MMRIVATPIEELRCISPRFRSPSSAFMLAFSGRLHAREKLEFEVAGTSERYCRTACPWLQSAGRT